MTSEPPKRGAVYFADLEEIGRKLVLIVSDDDVNQHLHPVVCLLTSTNRERSLQTYVTMEPSEAGVWKRTAILCHALLTIERWRLAEEPLGVVSAETQRKVDGALATALGLPLPPHG